MLTTISSVYQLVKNYWYLLVIAGLLAYCGVQKIHIVELQKDQIKLQAEFDTLKSTAQQCTDKVTQMEQDSKKLLDNVNAAQQNAAKILDNSKNTIAAILKQKIPTDCEGAMKDLVPKLKDPNWSK
ncbi:hypothetical protein [Ralstonia phage RP13]|nr:hypothetical protein [Ralstonia phage RP13]